MENNKFGLDAFTLKMIAAVTMLIDHIGYLFFPDYLLLRFIGRISFPIFAFFIVEGFMHTRNVKKYILRMAIFAVISEVPFDLAFFGSIYWLHQNVLFTFILSIFAMYIDNRYKRVVGVAATITLALTAEFIQCDYGMFGVVLVMIFYWNYQYFIGKMVAGIGGLTLLVSGYQRLDVLAMIPIALYNGKKGIGIQYFFYVFYPGHLMLLFLIHRIIG